MNSELHTLDLSSNLLGETEIEDFLFEKLDKLEILKLDSNSIVSLPEEIFNKNNNLVKLFLNNNSIASLDKNIFSNLWKLENLYLAMNDISEINKYLFDSLTNLRMLSLSVWVSMITKFYDFLEKQTDKSSRRNIQKSESADSSLSPGQSADTTATRIVG